MRKVKEQEVKNFIYKTYDGLLVDHIDDDKIIIKYWNPSNKGIHHKIGTDLNRYGIMFRITYKRDDYKRYICTMEIKTDDFMRFMEQYRNNGIIVNFRLGDENDLLKTGQLEYNNFDYDRIEEDLTDMLIDYGVDRDSIDINWQDEYTVLITGSVNVCNRCPDYDTCEYLKVNEYCDMAFYEYHIWGFIEEKTKEEV